MTSESPIACVSPGVEPGLTEPGACAPDPAGPAHRAAQRRAFATVFMIELWERFGFYGMAALMVLYMVEGMGSGDQQANHSWGAASALIYTLPVLGGWIGDRWLGTRRSMIAGAAVLVAGYGLLALPLDSMPLVFGSLALVAAGNGLFKPNSSNLVRRIYESESARIDSAFTMYYMAVNVGSTVSMLATPWVRMKWGWHAGFAVCCAGLFVGLLNYRVMRRSLLWVRAGADTAAFGLRQGAMLLGGVLLVTAAATFVLANPWAADACVIAAGVAVPTRGQIRDIGPGVSHKAQIVQLYLWGLQFTEIERRTRHSEGSIRRYLADFRQIAALYARGASIPEIRAASGRSASVISEYIAIYERARREFPAAPRLYDLLAPAGRAKKGGRR